MKKKFTSIIFSIFLLTGCGAGATKTMNCSYEATTGNITTSIVYNVDHEEDEIKKIRVTYDYYQNGDTNNINDDDANEIDNTGDNMDGIGTGTDGTTNDTQIDNDGIIDGIVGSTIDKIINGVTDTILDISGIRDRHTNIQNMYGNMNGFSVQNTNDTNPNNYHVTYIIDYDNMNDADLNTLNLSRDINTLKSIYTNQGFTCTE